MKNVCCVIIDDRTASPKLYVGTFTDQIYLDFLGMDYLII